jgi:Mismatch repair ATPase (MutS family)
MNNHKTLEFDQILQQLADNALSDIVKARCLTLVPSLNEAEIRRRLDETTQAKRIIEQIGTPPLPSMTDLQKVIGLIAIDAMLMPEQIAYVSSFLASCRRMKTYLQKAEATDTNIAWYGGSIDTLTELENEIERCIRNGMVDDKASARLANIRRQIGITTDQIKAKLEALLRKNKDWFSESFVSIRNGRYTLPVKRQHKNSLAGSVIDLSQTGGTCFIEPASVGRLQSELSTLQIEEDSEVRRILYSLTALIGDYLPAIKLNIEAMETLDFLFAKGKLSFAMKAAAVGITAGREIRIINARHPLLNPDTAVPLNFEIGSQTNGVIITGPNTGGKTVALKTVGLLSLMVHSGLHVPADENSILGMHNLVLCDIGDGQSITDNLSTFSSHMKNIIGILRQANHESLVLLDELGSGTDPDEGMGLAIAILDELSAKKCLFVVTTHYPQIKEYAANKPGLVNARMAFDKESLLPLYRLEIGKAGESCALYIAEKLGMPQHILKRAHEAAYGTSNQQNKSFIGPGNTSPVKAAIVPQIVKQEDQKPKTPSRSEKFNVGDSVIVYPQKETGIVYARSNDKGGIGVQIKGKKKLINHKRIKLQVAASELYPDDYDFSIIFDSVANRKARHQLEKGHYDGIIIIKEGEER